MTKIYGDINVTDYEKHFVTYFNGTICMTYHIIFSPLLENCNYRCFSHFTDTIINELAVLKVSLNSN